MKKLLLTLLLLTFYCNSSFAGFVHPLDYDRSIHKEEVLKYIQDRVKKDYCDNPYIKSCNESVYITLQKNEIKSLGLLVNAHNRPLLDQAINDSCNHPSGGGICNYSMINIMYNAILAADDLAKKYRQ